MPGMAGVLAQRHGEIRHLAAGPPPRTTGYGSWTGKLPGARATGEFSLAACRLHPADVAAAKANQSGGGEQRGSSDQPDQRRRRSLAEQEPGYVGKG